MSETPQDFCPICGGSGIVMDVKAELKCCGFLDEFGYCCNEPTQELEPVQLQCKNCEATGRISQPSVNQGAVNQPIYEYDHATDKGKHVAAVNHIPEDGITGEKIKESIMQIIEEETHVHRMPGPTTLILGVQEAGDRIFKELFQIALASRDERIKQLEEKNKEAMTRLSASTKRSIENLYREDELDKQLTATIQEQAAKIAELKGLLEKEVKAHPRWSGLPLDGDIDKFREQAWQDFVKEHGLCDCTSGLTNDAPDTEIIK